MSRSAVLIKINGDAAQFNSELKKVEKETKEVSASLGKVAAASSLGFGVLTAAIAASVAEYREGLKVSKSVEQTIRSTGGAAGVSAQDVDRLALSLQKVTNFGDETIATAQGIILTFTNIKKNIFPQVTELALDMAEKFGSAEGAAEFLGKALNNPIKGITQLQKAGVFFSEEQKKTIETLVKTGQVAEAQAILLDRLQSKYGGQARATADPFIQLRQVMGDLVQLIGSVFNPIAEKLAVALKGVAFYLLETNPQLLKIAAYTIGATAAILGLTAVITTGMFVYLKVAAVWAAYSASAGVATGATTVLTTAVGGLSTALKFLFTTPLGLAITALTALGVVLVANLDKVKAFWEGLKAVFGVVTEHWNALFGSAEDKAKVSGKSAAAAFVGAYNESIAKQELEEAKGKADPAADMAAKQQAVLEQAQWEYEHDQQTKQQKLDLEKQYAEELFRIHDESTQLELNREAFMANEQARIQLEEKKQRLSDEAKYGKSVADQKAFWRSKEVQGTGELFQTLSTLTSSKNRQLFDLGKAASLAHAGMNIAEGITKALSYGPFLGPAMAAAIGLAGAVQVATIAGTTLQAQQGFSGSGSAFGESLVSTFTPREIVVPERFSEGIKKGEYALASAKEQQSASPGEVTVHIVLAEDAAEVLEVKRIERNKLGIGIG